MPKCPDSSAPRHFGISAWTFRHHSRTLTAHHFTWLDPDLQLPLCLPWLVTTRLSGRPAHKLSYGFRLIQRRLINISLLTYRDLRLTSIRLAAGPVSNVDSRFWRVVTWRLAVSFDGVSWSRCTQLDKNGARQFGTWGRTVRHLGPNCL